MSRSVGSELLAEKKTPLDRIWEVFCFFLLVETRRCREVDLHQKSWQTLLPVVNAISYSYSNTPAPAQSLEDLH